MVISMYYNLRRLRPKNEHRNTVASHPNLTLPYAIDTKLILRCWAVICSKEVVIQYKSTTSTVQEKGHRYTGNDGRKNNLSISNVKEK